MLTHEEASAGAEKGMGSGFNHNQQTGGVRLL